jgi:hypothetical protein
MYTARRRYARFASRARARGLVLYKPLAVKPFLPQRDASTPPPPQERQATNHIQFHSTVRLSDLSKAVGNAATGLFSELWSF